MNDPAAGPSPQLMDVSYRPSTTLHHETMPVNVQQQIFPPSTEIALSRVMPMKKSRQGQNSRRQLTVSSVAAIDGGQTVRQHLEQQKQQQKLLQQQQAKELQMKEQQESQLRSMAAAVALSASTSVQSSLAQATATSAASSLQSGGMRSAFQAPAQNRRQVKRPSAPTPSHPQQVVVGPAPAHLVTTRNPILHTGPSPDVHAIQLQRPGADTYVVGSSQGASTSRAVPTQRNVAEYKPRTNVQAHLQASPIVRVKDPSRSSNQSSGGSPVHTQLQANRSHKYPTSVPSPPDTYIAENNAFMYRRRPITPQNVCNRNQASQGAFHHGDPGQMSRSGVTATHHIGKLPPIDKFPVAVAAIKPHQNGSSGAPLPVATSRGNGRAPPGCISSSRDSPSSYMSTNTFEQNNDSNVPQIIHARRLDSKPEHLPHLTQSKQCTMRPEGLPREMSVYYRRPRNVRTNYIVETFAVQDGRQGADPIIQRTEVSDNRTEIKTYSLDSKKHDTHVQVQSQTTIQHSNSLPNGGMSVSEPNSTYSGQSTPGSSTTASPHRSMPPPTCNIRSAPSTPIRSTVKRTEDESRVQNRVHEILQQAVREQQEDKSDHVEPSPSKTRRREGRNRRKTQSEQAVSAEPPAPPEHIQYHQLPSSPERPPQEPPGVVGSVAPQRNEQFNTDRLNYTRVYEPPQYDGRLQQPAIVNGPQMPMPNRTDNLPDLTEHNSGPYHTVVPGHVHHSEAVRQDSSAHHQYSQREDLIAPPNSRGHLINHQHLSHAQTQMPPSAPLVTNSREHHRPKYPNYGNSLDTSLGHVDANPVNDVLNGYSSLADVPTGSTEVPLAELDTLEGCLNVKVSDFTDLLDLIDHEYTPSQSDDQSGRQTPEDSQEEAPGVEQKLGNSDQQELFLFDQICAKVITARNSEGPSPVAEQEPVRKYPVVTIHDSDSEGEDSVEASMDAFNTIFSDDYDEAMQVDAFFGEYINGEMADNAVIPSEDPYETDMEGVSDGEYADEMQMHRPIERFLPEVVPALPVDDPLPNGEAYPNNGQLPIGYEYRSVEEMLDDVDDETLHTILLENCTPGDMSRTPTPPLTEEERAEKERLDRLLDEEMYAKKNQSLNREMHSLVIQNGALHDEVGRLTQRCQTISDERKILARRVNQQEKNRLRRLTTAKKRKEDALKSSQAREVLAAAEAKKKVADIKAAAASAAHKVTTAQSKQPTGANGTKKRKSTSSPQTSVKEKPKKPEKKQVDRKKEPEIERTLRSRRRDTNESEKPEEIAKADSRTKSTERSNNQRSSESNHDPTTVHEDKSIPKDSPPRDPVEMLNSLEKMANALPVSEWFKEFCREIVREHNQYRFKMDEFLDYDSGILLMRKVREMIDRQRERLKDDKIARRIGCVGRLDNLRRTYKTLERILVNPVQVIAALEKNKEMSSNKKPVYCNEVTTNFDVYIGLQQTGIQGTSEKIHKFRNELLLEFQDRFHRGEFDKTEYVCEKLIQLANLDIGNGILLPIEAMTVQPYCGFDRPETGPFSDESWKGDDDLMKFAKYINTKEPVKPTIEPTESKSEGVVELAVDAVEKPVKGRGRGRPRTRVRETADNETKEEHEKKTSEETKPTRKLRKRGPSREDIDEEDMTLGELAKKTRSKTREISEVKEKAPAITTEALPPEGSVEQSETKQEESPATTELRCRGAKRTRSNAAEVKPDEPDETEETRPRRGARPRTTVVVSGNVSDSGSDFNPRAPTKKPRNKRTTKKQGKITTSEVVASEEPAADAPPVRARRGRPPRVPSRMSDADSSSRMTPVSNLDTADGEVTTLDDSDIIRPPTPAETPPPVKETKLRGSTSASRRRSSVSNRSSVARSSPFETPNSKTNSVRESPQEEAERNASARRKSLRTRASATGDSPDAPPATRTRTSTRANPERAANRKS